MGVRFLLGYWAAWKILPISGKFLLIAGYFVSAVIYWSATAATPSPNAECLTGLCNVSQEAIATTKILGIVALIGMTAMSIIGLTAINVAMEKHPEKASRLLHQFDGISTNNFWERLE